MKAASEEWERRTPTHVIDVEIRLYEADVEYKNCENFDCDLMIFKDVD